MKIKALFILATAVAISFTSCKDEDPDPPVTPPTNNGGGGGGGGATEPPADFRASLDSSNKDVYLEIYTGVRDNNWPSTETKLNSYIGFLNSQGYPGRLHVVTIHQGEVAAKDPRYTTDAVYTNLFSDDLAQMAFNEDLNDIGPYSTGSINRIKAGQGIVYNAASTGGMTMSDAQWRDKAVEVFNQYSSVNIGANATFSGNDLTVNVDLYYTGNEPDSNYIHVALLQDDLRSDQWAGSSSLQDYAHNDVLRDLITGFKGDRITIATPPKSWVRKSYTYEIPGNYNGTGANGGGAIVYSDLEVVVFVTRKNGQIITAQKIDPQ